MKNAFVFAIDTLPLDENYAPADTTRLTTNFANLARGEDREQNLRKALNMINNRFNALAHWDNKQGERYRVELEIVSVNISIAGNQQCFPSIEVLKTSILDRHTHERIDGIVGNNFSSYLRDYDFSIVLQEYNKGRDAFSIPDDFGELHGKLFQCFIKSPIYQAHFDKPPVICLSVSDNKTYHKTDNHHPVLGFEYQPNDSSLTEQYFKKMGLEVRYFMPPQSAAPLAFYFMGDLLNDYSNLELISTIATMETFQKIYRPEIYNANACAGKCYKPNLHNQDHSLTQIVYDREERSRLAIEQGKFAEAFFVKPHQDLLKKWSQDFRL